LKNLITNLRYFFSRGAGKYPAFVALCGTLCGIFICGDSILGRIVVIIAVAATSIFLPRFRILIFLLFLTAGAGVMLINNYFSHSALPEIGNGLLEAQVIDAACGGTQNRWLKNPSLLTVAAMRYKSNRMAWENGSGKIALQLPRDAPRLSYGDIVRLEGRWLETEDNPRIRTVKLMTDGKISVDCERQLQGFNFNHYLRTRGIYRRFQVRKITVLRQQNSFFATIMGWRNSLLASTVKGIKSTEQRGMLAALLFGCKQGLPRSSRRTFIYSGTIHIFTVSGLHVGLLGFLLLWLLRWVPFSTRHLLIPGLLLIYVISTGMHPPALRAWLMITIWCCCRARLLHTPALNIVFVTATLLLLFNPLYPGDAGFQFSFIVVGFLVAASGRINRFLQLLFEKWNWIPSKLHSTLAIQRVKWLRRLTASLLGCMVAWLASSGIALYYQGVYVPAAVMANFLIMPLVWILFIVVGVRFVAIVITFIIPFINGIFSAIINSTVVICELFYRCFGSIPTPRPTFGSLIIFYLVAVGLVGGKKRLTLILSATGMAAVLIYWHSSAVFADPSLFIIHGGDSQEPTIIFCDPRQNLATVINVPSWQTAGIISDCLRDKGITRISRLVICGTGKKFCSGSGRLLKSVDTEQMVIPYPLRSRYARTAVSSAVENGATVVHPLKTAAGNSFSRSDLTVKQDKLRVTIDYHNLSGNIRVEISNNGLGVRTITVSSNNQQQYKLELINNNKVEITELIIE
jgi:competence protein ComEC